MVADTARFGRGRARITVTIPDSRHVSGGPFCCVVSAAPIASASPESDAPVTVDFIALNVYGIVRFNSRLLEASKLQSNLQFGFLREERKALRSTEGALLIFASDPVIFSTCTEIAPGSPESFYRFTCSIPPFIPPTVNGENVSCNYYVDVTVQYSASTADSPLRASLRRKLEFHVVGSVYPGLPTVDASFYPFLPKSGGHRLVDGRLAESALPKVCLDIISANYGQENAFFNYDSRIDTLEAGGESSAVPVQAPPPPPQSFLLARDLNAFWHVWDTMNGCGFHHETNEACLMRRYNDVLERFAELVERDASGLELEAFRPWFGGLLQPSLYDGSDEAQEAARTEMVQLFDERIESRVAAAYGTTFETLRLAACDSIEVQREMSSDDSTKVLSFSLDGKRLCTCNLQGFGQLSGAKEFTLPLHSWFTIFFEFTDPFRCLQVEINLVRSDTAGVSEVRSSEVCVLQHSLFTLGKSCSNVTLFAPQHATPSFACSFLRVAYRLELCFYHFADSADLPKPEAVKQGLAKLRMLKWSSPVRVLQSESLRVHARCFRRDEPVSPDDLVRFARAACARPRSPKLLQGAPALSTSFNID